jgi:hypothetical protein
MRILTFLIPFTVPTFTALLFGTQTPRADILVKDGESIAFLSDSITQFGAQSPGGYVRLVEGVLADQGVVITVIPAGISCS